MKPRVYVETSVVSYLTAGAARDMVIAGHQHSTHESWAGAAGRFELVMSDLVLQEAGGAAPAPAAGRVRGDALGSVGRLDATTAVQGLTERLAATDAVPPREKAAGPAGLTIGGDDHGA